MIHSAPKVWNDENIFRLRFSKWPGQVNFVSFNSYLCNQLGNALFCVTSGIFAGRAQRDPAKSHELHKIAFFLILTKKKVSSNVKRNNEFH
jgi:hypothetical protein